MVDTHWILWGRFRLRCRCGFNTGKWGGCQSARKVGRGWEVGRLGGWEVEMEMEVEVGALARLIEDEVGKLGG